MPASSASVAARPAEPRLGLGRLPRPVLDALGRLDDPRIAHVVLDAYPETEPDLKPKAIELLTQRPAWSKALLAAVAARNVPTSALNVNQLRKLQAQQGRRYRQQVKAIWGTIREGRNPQRELVVGQMRQLPAQDARRPDRRPGRLQEALRPVPQDLRRGPGRRPRHHPQRPQRLRPALSNVFDPSLVIGPGYQATTVATTDGRVLTGLLAEDSKERVVLKIQGGKLETIPRKPGRGDQDQPALADARGHREPAHTAGDRRPVRFPGPGQAARRPEREAAPRIAGGKDGVAVKSYLHTPLYPTAAPA